jgi:DNA repair protein RecO (recombination protein O)
MKERRKVSQTVIVTGMVLSAAPSGEYDKRVVLLTKEKGKIAAFAKGARRQNSPLLAACNPFSFGEFVLYEGRNSYNIMNVSISNYFMELMTDFEGAYYGFYFLELADYYGREYNDEKEMLKLVYAALLALTKKRIPFLLIRYIFELKLICINGEGPQVFHCVACGEKKEHMVFSAGRGGMICQDCLSAAKKSGREIRDGIRLGASTIYTLQFIAATPVAKLFSFVVTDEVLAELGQVMKNYMKLHVDRQFKSLEILNSLEK